MMFPSRWEILIISLWTQVGFLPWMHCKDGTGVHLSQEDLLALKDEQNPKCFARTKWDGICFFESADNGTYDLFHKVEEWNMCQMSVQETEEGKFLHICSFSPHFYVETNVIVVKHNTNATFYNRTVNMDELMLLNPPFSVSLHQTGKAGQLKVSWKSNISKYDKDNVIYRIRYSSKTLGETREAKEGEILDSLEPGEEVEVQVQVKSRFSRTGLWSSWSHPVRAVVPQSADNISTKCYTPDLQNIICQWNGSRYGEDNEYKLYYKTNLSEVSGWTDWTECLADRNLTGQCSFRGEESRKVMVKLSNAPAPLSRTFYTQEFTLRNNIKTSPPSHLRGALENWRLCLNWEAPPSPSAHLQYEISYQITRKGEKTVAALYDCQSGDCLTVPAGSKYGVKIRARPMGSIYWSDWSDELTGGTPADDNTLLLLFIPALVLITAIVLIYQFNTPLRKFKLYFWPPVPNLDKVLQGYLTEINGQTWNPPLITKQCSEETIPSLVEIMSDDEVSGSGKPQEESTQLLSPEGSFLCREQADGSPGTEVFPDYVTLNKDSVILCPKGNKYFVEYEISMCEKEAPAVKNELLQSCNSSCADGSVCTKPCCTDFLNHSYLLLAEPAGGVHCKVTAMRVPGNLYTNLPCS
ncbi:thrombopoietin receptor [Acanthopagrus latus]|uniref:thrombopoietin receptor n=1 Tax=Acanthopagrus latus TaxID=8177 RepID=UPI00187BE9B8|nr:thrombopoietin receptor [Acanthopagrus latus]